MEIAASILGSTVAEAGHLLCDPICSSIKSTVRIQSNLQALEKKISALIALRNDIKRQLALAEKDGKLPTTQVKEWLREVEEFITEADRMKEQATAIEETLCHCFFSCCLKCRHGGKVAKMLKEAQGLESAGNFPTGLVIKNPEAKPVEFIPGPSIQDQTTSSRTLGELMNLLGRDEIKRIGIWGLGGIGKTTLVKNLNNRLKSDPSAHRFGIVIWATASKELDLRRVQVQIAERLNLDVKIDESTQRLGIRLHERLVKEDNFLLILDDVWEAIDLDSLGVPKPEYHRGSRIILTSRTLEVCMEMRTDAEVRVDLLNDDEAWQLFSQNAGVVSSKDPIKLLAQAIAKECKGLPLAIITMGTAMRGKTNVRLWEHALKEWRKSVPFIKGIENYVFSSLKWSYDALQSTSIRYCFLYCSLFPEDFSIEVSELVRCWLAEGLLEEQENYEDSFNRGIALTENLKDHCLLENGAREGTVKMHDVIRDVAIWIASSSENACKSLVRSGVGLTQVSEIELVNSLKRVSLMNNSITKLPDNGIHCPETSTLLLQGNFPLDRVPEKFLQGFPSLRVLNLNGTRIQSLPLSLLQIHELRALLLRDCFYLIGLPPLGSLTELQDLDLCATSIRELPREMEKLCKLRQVNLSRTHYLKKIQAGIICRLSSLEVLDMTLSDYHWRLRGQVEEEQTDFEELGSLERLLVLSIRLEGIPSQGSEDYTWMDRLRSFQLFIGPTVNSLPTKHDERRVTISSLDLSGEWIGWLLTHASSLILSNCRGLNQVLETLVIHSTGAFFGLKSLTIARSNSSLKPTGGCAAHDDLLPNLEELYLQELTYLENISELVGFLGLRFSKLKLMEVTQCHRLKHLLTYGSFILVLPKLQELKVSFCDNLVELFNYYSETNFPPEPVSPKLRTLKLKNLPKLKIVCRQEETWQSLEKIKVVKCNLLRQLPLTAQNENSVKEIVGELQWWNLLHCGHDTRSSLQPYFTPARGKMEIGPMEMQKIDGKVL